MQISVLSWGNKSSSPRFYLCFGLFFLENIQTYVVVALADLHIIEKQTVGLRGGLHFPSSSLVQQCGFWSVKTDLSLSIITYFFKWKKFPGNYWLDIFLKRSSVWQSTPHIFTLGSNSFFFFAIGIKQLHKKKGWPLAENGGGQYFFTVWRALLAKCYELRAITTRCHQGHCDSYKLALQRHSIFFIEYCYTWYISVFTFRRKVKKDEISWIFYVNCVTVIFFLIKFTFRVLWVELKWNSVFWSCWWNTPGIDIIIKPRDLQLSWNLLTHIFYAVPGFVEQKQLKSSGFFCKQSSISVRYQLMFFWHLALT